jgi:multicomponent Na+:H+ antiporter subunit G
MTTIDIVASVFLVLGSLMSLLAGIAVLRFPDTMSRIHAATKPQVLGIILLMVGVGLRLGSPGVIGMLVLIVILQFVTAPVSAHLTVRVAYRNATGEEERASEPSTQSAADDGPEQMIQAMVKENTAARSDRDGLGKSGSAADDER